MDTILDFISGGLLQLGWWQIILVTLVLTHITIAAVTIYLHRSQAHRGLDLHPAVAHFFRFWLWLTTGMVTREWVAIHRKHHAKCEREGDPHSPMIYGIDRVLWKGAELYREEAANEETLKRFSHGTPNDWMERNVYSRHTTLGIFTMLTIDLLLFGAIGLTVWAVQMAWIPFWAAGVVNGLGHYIGYRNFSSPDTSTNLFPIGILIGGEELHNNHHAYGTSAKFSSKWYEFDIGWVYIRILQALRLAQVKKVAPKLKLVREKSESVTEQTLQGVITHRYEIMARYASMLRQSVQSEIKRLTQAGANDQERELLQKVQSRLGQADLALNPQEKQELDSMLSQNTMLAKLVHMREELYRVWTSSTASSEQLLGDLQQWCQHAQQSGIQSLEQFALRLRRYAA
ncbi:DesA family fatty acid desaturase [Advenella mimigardefordensis]|uniref:Putative fatty acid desaturase n=1 Tax=Advenella mimigardefordensis (strain DSM 17166 / LMG 22922 / DPN7) TaxID=1247726 RepID=W0PE21_ADVMD|nr:fatty acid desaturase [Advenella mimigardefordensis]AHG63687.1 putative fatty acid desaturase [Advenella mimigardefordensis DPN7]